jgi:hypothetical protein
LTKKEEKPPFYSKNPKAKTFYGAPTVLNILTDKTKPTPIENGNLVIGNLLNAAAEGKDLAKKWGLSKDYE